MALLDRLFPSRRKNHKPGYVNFRSCNTESWKPFSFSKEQVRVLLFRECDWRGRKLLFDSKAVVKISLGNHQCSKLKLGSKLKSDTKKTETYVEISNGYGYQYTKPNPDVTVMGEMIFGSVAMSFRGSAFKVHTIKSPSRIMWTKVFHSPVNNQHNGNISDHSLEDSYASSLNSVNECVTSYSSIVMPGSGPLDVPTKLSGGSVEVDSGFCGDASLQSASSVGSGGYLSSPDSRRSSLPAAFLPVAAAGASGGSLASLQRRWLRTVATSLEHSCESGTSGGDEGSSQGIPRRTRLGLALVISLTVEVETAMQQFLFEHASIVEAIVERLRAFVEHAYTRKDMFVHLMVQGCQDAQQWLVDVLSAPRLPTPVWLGLCARPSVDLAPGFLQDLCQLVAELDTKACNFFMSTLVTGVLTYHLGWVATVLPGTPSQTVPDTEASAGTLLDSLSRSHPYNPLWAQLGDLCGAVAQPPRMARTIVTTSPRKADTVNKILGCLTYFIRCGRVECQEQVRESRDGELDMLRRALAGDVAGLALHNEGSSVSVRSFPTRMPVSQGSPGLQHQSSGVNISHSHTMTGSFIQTVVSSPVEHSPKRSCSSRTLHPACESASSMHESVLFTSRMSEGESSADESCESAVLIHHRMNGAVSWSRGNDSIRQALRVEPTHGLTRNTSFVARTDTRLSALELDPMTIAEKVSRLCRVPTAAVLHQTARDPPQPRKENCESQQSSAGGVVFVLGDDDQLVGLRGDSKAGNTIDTTANLGGDTENRGFDVVGLVSSDTDRCEGSSSRVVTVRSSLIELEPESGVLGVKAVSRSHSLSFPDHSQAPRPGRLCRRNSDCNADKLRYRKDYHSVRFHFERCDGVLTNSVAASEGDKCIVSSKPNQLSEARGNFHWQEDLEKNLEMCRKCLGCKNVQHKGGGPREQYTNALFESDVNKNIQSEFCDSEVNAMQRECECLPSEEPAVSKPVEALHLVELPLPRSVPAGPRLATGLAPSLLGGVSERYQPDMVLQGCSQLPCGWEAELKRDLSLAAHHPALDQDVAEAVCVLGNANNWEVQLVSTHTYVVDKPGTLGVRVGMSQLVANMLESVMHLWRHNTAPEHCLLHLESKLREMCLRSQAVAQLLLTSQFCDMQFLTSALDLEANDVPLLLAVAATHTPEISRRCGLSFR